MEGSATASLSPCLHRFPVHSLQDSGSAATMSTIPLRSLDILDTPPSTHNQSWPQRLFFIVPLSSPRLCTLTSSRHGSLICHHQAANYVRDGSMYRRHRPTLKAHMDRNSNGNSESDAPNMDGGDETANKNAELDAADTEASDTSLPNLRDLFEGAGTPGCEQCGGSGDVSCVVCDGKGIFSLTMMDITSASVCRMCRGRRHIPCPTCRAIVFKSVMWWDQIPDIDEDPDEKWRDGADGPRMPWGKAPNQL